MSASILDDPHLKSKCQVFTPADIVSKMLDLAGYKNGVYGKKVLENSCGDGEILLQIVQRYIADCFERRLSVDEIKLGLERDIVAYEIDDAKVSECTNRLDEYVEKYKILDVHWDIRCKDYLQENTEELYHFIIGNPPYMSYPDLPVDVREFVKSNFTTCQKGKFDYSYAFTEKSYKSLLEGGVLVYIIPSNIFKNVFASCLRELIKRDLNTIFDYPDENVFRNALVSPAIMKVVKGENSRELVYETQKCKKIIRKVFLKDKWNFFLQDASPKGKRIGDYFKVASAVATLYNKIFILRNGVFRDGYYCFGDFKIEEALLRKAAGPKGRRDDADEFIIFPYDYDPLGGLVHYSEEEMYVRFPCAMKYLEDHKSKLEQRKADGKAQWFEYGRSQALQCINREKILISSIISNRTRAYLLKKDEVPYSGLYIVPIRDADLKELSDVLNSQKFKQYICNAGACVNGKSRRVCPEDIENYIY